MGLNDDKAIAMRLVASTVGNKPHRGSASCCAARSENDRPQIRPRLSRRTTQCAGASTPGRINMFTAVSNRGQNPSCKTTRFYNDAKHAGSNGAIKRMYEERPDTKAELYNMPTNKTASLLMLNNYVQYLPSRLIKLLRFHMDKGFRGLKFQRHQARRKALDLWKEFTKEAEQKTIVGFGDWSNDPGSTVKGHPVDPVKAFEKCLRRRCIVVSIGEHRTSMLHHHHHTILVDQRRKTKDEDGTVRVHEPYSGRYCEHCKDEKVQGGCCGNRDYNAARNILKLAELKLSIELPLMNFRRGVHQKFFTAFSVESTSAGSTRGCQVRVLCWTRKGRHGWRIRHQIVTDSMKSCECKK